MNVAERISTQHGTSPARMPGVDDYLTDVLSYLAASGYHFIPLTPLTHQRFNARAASHTYPSLRHILGWNVALPVSDDVQPLSASVAQANTLLGDSTPHSAVRVASLDEDLFLHFAYPTNEDNAIFFGPDTCRFVCILRQWAPETALHALTQATQKPVRILAAGCGSGTGGITAIHMLTAMAQDTELTLLDINPRALESAAINAKFAQVPATIRLSDGFQNLTSAFDLIIATPPFIEDEQERTYQHGDAQLGRSLSDQLATEVLAYLAPGGTLILNTGATIVGGSDGLLANLHTPLQQSSCNWSYAEIDPDVFGQKLDRPAYHRAERIAAIGVIATRPQQVRS